MIYFDFYKLVPKGYKKATYNVLYFMHIWVGENIIVY